MSTPYTPTATKLVELNLPQDVIDKVIVATVNPNSQAVADGIQYAYGIQECVGRYTIAVPGGSPYAVGNNWVLTPISEGPGLAYDAGSKWIVVSEPGNYLVTVQCMIQCTDTTDPLPVSLLALAISGVSTQTMCAPQTIRWNGTGLFSFPISGAGVGHIPTSGYKIALRAYSPGSVDYYPVSDPFNRLTVHRIS